MQFSSIKDNTKHARAVLFKHYRQNYTRAYHVQAVKTKLYTYMQCSSIEDKTEHARAVLKH